MRRTLASVLVPLLVLLACHTSEERKIDQTLNRREEAFRKKDLSLYMSCISSGYQNKEEDFTALKARMEGYFKTFDRIEYSSWDRSVEIAGKDAEVVQQFRLEVERGGKKNQYLGREFLFLKHEGGEWKIAKGL